jgi:hypothetical protein
LIGRGKRAAASSLLKKAKKDRSWLDLKTFTAIPFSPDLGKETPIMRSAGKRAEKAGLQSIAKILGVLPSRVAFARRARQARGIEKALPDALLKSAQLKQLSGERPWWLYPLIGGLGIIALGIVLRPYLGAGKQLSRRRR